jgi:hypothetical protein
MEGKEMRITEKMLLDGYVGMSNGYNYISDITIPGPYRALDGTVKENELVRYWWNYRHNTGDGYQPITDRSKAEWINLDNPFPYGHIEIDPSCDNHPNVQKIYEDEQNHYSMA